MPLIPILRQRTEIAWSSYPRGVFTIGSSLLSGPDTLGTSPFDETFGGEHDDVSERFIAAAVERGRSATLEQMRAGGMTLALRDPDGTYNAQNPGSPLAGLIESRLHPVRFQLQAGKLVALTRSGGYIDDIVRAKALSGDGRDPEGSHGIWEATTNLVENGGFETSGTTWWSVTNAALSRVAGGKFGDWRGRATQTAGTFYGIQRLIAISGATAGRKFTFSLWAGAVDGSVGDTVRLRVTEEGGASGAVSYDANYTLEEVDWTALDEDDRLTLTVTVAANDRTGLRINAIQTTGVATGEMFDYDGVQFEEQPIATPYVETDGATASRAAARVQAPASLLDETQGWVAVRIRLPSATLGNADPCVFELGEFGAGFIGVTLNGTNLWRLWRHTAAGGSVSVVHAFAAAEFTVVAAWTATQIKLSVNGGAFTVAANTDIPGIADAAFDIGSDDGSLQHLDGDVLWLACGTGTLTDADAAALADVSEDPQLLDLPAAAAATLIWTADDGSAIAPGSMETQMYGWARRVHWNRDTLTATVEVVDLFYWLSRVRPLIASTGLTTTGGAIAKVLDAVGWTIPGARALDDGDRILDFSADGSKSCLQLIEELLTAERGVFFIAGDGTAVYRDRHNRLTAGVVATLANQLKTVDPGVDVDVVITTARVTREGGVEQTFTDATAERRWGASDLEIGTPYLENDEHAGNLARETVRQNANPRPPIRPLDLGARTDFLLAQIIARELGDRLFVSEEVGGGRGEFMLERLELDVGQRAAEASWTLSEAPIVNALVIGSGQIGTGELVY